MPCHPTWVMPKPIYLQEGRSIRGPKVAEGMPLLIEPSSSACTRKPLRKAEHEKAANGCVIGPCRRMGSTVGQGPVDHNWLARERATILVRSVDPTTVKESDAQPKRKKEVKSPRCHFILLVGH